MILDKQNYLSREKVPNENNTDVIEYNCGGWAFQTFDWFTPYNMEKMKSRFYDLESCIYIEVEKIQDRFLWEDVDYMLGTFDNLRVIDSIDEVSEKSTVIAYRIGVFEDVDEYDYDFHFKVRRNGVWSEKIGGYSIQSCTEEDIFSDWVNPYDNFEYSSELILFELEE